MKNFLTRFTVRKRGNNMALYPEENGYYALSIDNNDNIICDLHETFHKNGVSILCDADFVIKSDDSQIIILEYKNGTVGRAAEYTSFKPSDDKYIQKVARKFYDTMVYLNHMGYFDPMKYVYVLEFPNDDPVTRKFVRDQIITLLPFKLQQDSRIKHQLIDSFEVLSISEWNEKYPMYELVALNNG